MEDPACGGNPGETQAGETQTGETQTGESNDSVADTTDETGDEPACPDVQGNYSLTLSSTSPEDCEDILANGDQCSVSEDGCDLIWGCDGEYGALLVPGPVDMSGVYETSGTFQGFSYTCEVTFLSTGSFAPDLNWNCSVGQAGQALLCEGTGSL